MGRSDMVRRAMSKKKHKVMEEERKNFIYGIVDENGEIEVPGCIRNGISEEAANKIFDQMMDFASYAFNKSHAAAYALVGYYTAYLMYYHPTEYIAAMLNSVMGNNEKVAFYIRFAKEHNIEVLAPDINESFWKFTAKENTIRFGLGAIKNVGSNVISSIVRTREEKGDFTDFGDFINKIDTSEINKRAVESLIKAGAFDSFMIFRSRLLAVYEKLLDGASNDRKRNIAGQMNLFTDFEESYKSLEISYPNIKEFEKKYILAMEKEMTGIYISGHPLDDYVDTLEEMTDTTTIDIIGSVELEGETVDGGNYIKDGDRVKIGGIISLVTKKFTKNNDIMAFINVQDLYGEVEVIVFPKTMEKNMMYIKEDALILIKGRITKREDEAPKVICENIEPLIKVEDEKVYIRVANRRAATEAKNILKYLNEFMKGGCPTLIFIEEDRKAYKMPSDLWVNSKLDTMEFLKASFGEENVKIK